jgi:hypothetical protein
MTNERDPVLSSLFASSIVDQDDKEFTEHVVAKTRSFRYKIVAGLLAVALVLVAFAWIFSLPVQEILQLITQGLTTRLADLGDGWPAWILAPINNVASVLVLSLKAIRMLRKKIISTSYVS